MRQYDPCRSNWRTTRSGCVGVTQKNHQRNPRHRTAAKQNTVHGMELIVIVSGAANSLVFSIYFLFSYLINTAIPFLKRIKLGIDRLGILFQNFNIIYQQIKKMMFKKNICLMHWTFDLRYTVEAGIHCKKKNQIYKLKELTT